MHLGIFKHLPLICDENIPTLESRIILKIEGVRKKDRGH